MSDRGKYGYGKCPFCGADADADEIDIDVGTQQCGPVNCPACLAYRDDDDGKWQSGPDEAPC